MMLGEQSSSADYWKQCGDEALAHGIKGVVMMGAHWDATWDAIEVATTPSPGKSPVAYVHPSKYQDYKLNPDLPTANRCLTMLKDAGFNARANDTFEWIQYVDSIFAAWRGASANAYFLLVIPTSFSFVCFRRHVHRLLSSP